MELRDEYKEMPSDLFEAYHGGMDIVCGVPKTRPDAPSTTVECKYGCGRELGYNPGLDEWRGFGKERACMPCGMARR